MRAAMLFQVDHFLPFPQKRLEDRPTQVDLVFGPAVEAYTPNPTHRRLWVRERHTDVFRLEFNEPHPRARTRAGEPHVVGVLW